MLWMIWRTDDLKSMGMVVPFVCAALILREWRRLGWETQGSWWGFAVLAISAALMFLRDQTLFIVTINKDWLLQIPPLPLVAVVYAAGMVLLFGGTRLLRAAWFPVLLMWAVIPVPQTFSRFIDLPLQHAAASSPAPSRTPSASSSRRTSSASCSRPSSACSSRPAATAFAAPSPLASPRSSSPSSIASAGTSSLRSSPALCCSATSSTSCASACWSSITRSRSVTTGWQNHARQADLVIGGCLFVLALVIFFAVAERLRRDPEDVRPDSIRNLR